MEEDKGVTEDVTLTDGTMNFCTTINLEKSPAKQDDPSHPTFSPILAKTPDSPVLAVPPPPKAPFFDRIPKGPKADSIPKGPSAGLLLATSVVDRHSAHWFRAIKNSGSIYNARQRSKRIRALTRTAGPAPALMSAKGMSAALAQVGAGTEVKMEVKMEAGASTQTVGSRSSAVRSMVKSTQIRHDGKTANLPKKRKLEEKTTVADVGERRGEKSEQTLEEGELKEDRERDFYAAEREEMNRKRDAHKSKRRAPNAEAPAVTGKTWAQRAEETMPAVGVSMKANTKANTKAKTWEERAREASGRATV